MADGDQVTSLPAYSSKRGTRVFRQLVTIPTRPRLIYSAVLELIRLLRNRAFQPRDRDTLLLDVRVSRLMVLIPGIPIVLSLDGSGCWIDGMSFRSFRNAVKKL